MENSLIQAVQHNSMIGAFVTVGVGRTKLPASRAVAQGANLEGGAMASLE